MDARLKQTLLILAAGILLVQLGCAGGQPRSALPAPQPPQAGPALPAASCAEEKWGVQVLGVRLSAAGYMLDFRYRVLDEDKAAYLSRRDLKPQLIDVASGAKCYVPSSPKVGPLRHTTNPPQAGKTYSIIFGNPGRLVHAGSQVCVVIGEFRAENLTVE